jgi:hypothetical protein
VRKIAAYAVVIALAVCVFDAQTAFAQFARPRRSYGATYVGFPRGVRNIGMGATGAADASNLSTGYFNPASVAFANATSLVSSYEDLYRDFGLSEFAVSSSIPFHSDSRGGGWRFAGSLGYTRFWLPTQHERTVFLPEGTGKTWDDDDWMLSGLAAALWSRGVLSLAAGGTTKLIQLAPTGFTMWSFDVGIVAAFPLELGGGLIRPRFGYSALNLDSGASYDGSEMLVQTEQRGGFGFDMETPPTLAWGKSVPAVSFALDYDLIDREGRSSEDFASGFEVSVIDLMHIRYGTIANSYTTYGLGVGWDYGHVLFRMDYAHTAPRDASRWAFIDDSDRDTVGALVGVRW